MRSSSQCFEGARGWFSLALLKKNITRFWPIWGIYTAILFFALPMEIVLNGRGNEVRYLTNGMMVIAVPMGTFFGLVTAMALFAYLMNVKASQMFHALPIRREGLFITNWVTGLCFFLIPNLFILLASFVACGVAGVKGTADLLLWFAVATAAPMFFFCFALLCAMFTGHILALPAFYGILNALVVGVCALLDAAGGELLYNYSGMEMASSTFARWCTPVYQIIYLLAEGDSIVNGAAAAVGYCVVLGATFTLIALLVYQRRQLERAGDLVTVGWVRPVFQWGFGACIGLLVGLMIYWNFFRVQGPWAYIVTVTVCAVLGAFAGRMLLKKTLRVFADGWKSCMALGLAVFLLMTGVMLDAFGFQRWTPDPVKVASVYVNQLHSEPRDDASYLSVEIVDPALIAQVTDLHKALNAKLPELKESKRQGVMIQTDGDGNQLQGEVNISFRYTMTDGSVVTRRYSEVPVYAGDLNDPGTYTYQLARLINDPIVEALAYRYYGAEEPQNLRATGGWITRVDPEDREAEAAVELVNEEVGVETKTAASWMEYTLEADEAVRLWEAFREDVEAGRVKRYLLDEADMWENCYGSDITLSLAWTEVDEKGNRYTNSRDLSFIPQKSQTSVMAVLEELGLKDRLRQQYAGR